MTNIPLSGIPARYTPLDSHGSGGMSDVFFFYDTNLERNVAIKSIRDISQIDRLTDEINALMQLRSKHVVQVYDVTPSVDDSFGIVMEHVNGSDLVDIPAHLKQPENLLKLLWQIASGISDIHASGIIHRDIKPNNMKLDEEGILKIFDFGLARNQGLNAQTVGFRGTYYFSAPEQYQGGNVNFTTAVDVYAFGVTALYLITENLPPELLRVPPTPITGNVYDGTFLSSYPRLVELFEQCLSQVPDDRPRMMEVVDEIGKHLLLNKHQALTVHNGNSHTLNSVSRSVQLSLGTIGSCHLQYDGLNFTMTNVIGEVYVNNGLITQNRQMKGACVIAIGGAHRHAYERNYITFDISNPEVTL
ncbi:serine/threonine protein kinase [Vibrio splendidus]